MIRVRTHLLTRRELQHVLLLMLVRGRWPTHLWAAGVGRSQNHRLTVMNAITRSICQAGTGCFAGELSGQELVGG